MMVICSFVSLTERMVLLISSSVIESRADVASSKIKSFGFFMKALASAILYFYPPDS